MSNKCPYPNACPHEKAGICNSDAVVGGCFPEKDRFCHEDGIEVARIIEATRKFDNKMMSQNEFHGRLYEEAYKLYRKESQ